MRKWTGYFYFYVHSSCSANSTRKEKPQTENLGDLHYKSITNPKMFFNQKHAENFIPILQSSIKLRNKRKALQW